MRVKKKRLGTDNHHKTSVPIFRVFHPPGIDCTRVKNNNNNNNNNIFRVVPAVLSQGLDYNTCNVIVSLSIKYPPPCIQPQKLYLVFLRVNHHHPGDFPQICTYIYKFFFVKLCTK